MTNKRLPRKRHKLSKRDLLDYALEGAKTRLGIGMGFIGNKEKELLDRDIREIERRIQLVEYAASVEARKEYETTNVVPLR